MKKHVSLALAATILLVVSGNSLAQEISGAMGGTGQGGFTGRIGLGFDWGRSWLQSESGRLTGYWDAGATHWDGGRQASSRTSLSFAPVFVYEFTPLSTITPFIEAGVGVSLFSGTRAGDRHLGSSFNFEDRLGVGVKFANNDRVGLRVIHYSNAGLKEPNAGIESYALFYAHAF
ncbi:acyloxyacyl hydrolase [Pseudomonas gingeri]